MSGVADGARDLAISAGKTESGDVLVVVRDSDLERLRGGWFGVAIAPHHFRHCLATSIARETPAKAPIATAILGTARLA